MPTLSLAMIVKNESANLARCLRSVQALVDEMVVVDTGSTDDTVAIAESFGARIGHFPWCDDFAAARNESLRLCTGDWVLVLDGDEAIDALDHGRIRQAIARAPFFAFHLALRNYFLEGSSATFDRAAERNLSSYSEGSAFTHYSDTVALRLCKRFPDLRFEGRIHELLNPYFHGKKLPIGRLEAVIHHYGKVDPSREDAKKAYYLRLAEEEAAAHPGDSQCQFNLMCQAHIAEDWEKALAAAETYLKLSREVPLTVHMIAAMAHQKARRHQAAVNHLETILASQPDHPMALSQLPLSLIFLGRVEESRAALQKAIALQPGFPPPYISLAEIEGREGHFDAAREVLRKGLDHNPQEERLWQSLVMLDLQHQEEPQAVADAWEAIQALPSGGGGQWHALVGGFLLKSGEVEQARAVLAMGLKAFPEHDSLRRLDSLAVRTP